MLLPSVSTLQHPPQPRTDVILCAVALRSPVPPAIPLRRRPERRQPHEDPPAPSRLAPAALPAALGTSPGPGARPALAPPRAVTASYVRPSASASRIFRHLIAFAPGPSLTFAARVQPLGCERVAPLQCRRPLHLERAMIDPLTNLGPLERVVLQPGPDRAHALDLRPAGLLGIEHPGLLHEPLDPSTRVDVRICA